MATYFTLPFSFMKGSCAYHEGSFDFLSKITALLVVTIYVFCYV